MAITGTDTMAMKRILTVCGALFLALLSMGQPKTLYLDPGKTIGAPASRVFEEINFIPLETTKKSLLGNIRQLVVTQDYFVIYDSDTDALYFFDKKGKFIHKYKQKKYRIKDIQLDHSKNALLIFSLNKNYNVPSVKVQQYLEPESKKDVSKFAKATYYYLADVKKQQTEILKDFRYAFTNPVLFDHGKFAASFIKASKNTRDTLDYQLKIINNRDVLQTYFPYNKKTESIYYYYGAARCDIMATQNDSVLFVTKPFQYEIYTLTPDSIRSSYKLVLPMENSVPASFFNAPFSNKGEMDTYRMANGSYVGQIQNVIGMKQLLFFNLNLFRGYHRYIYDNSTNLIYDFNKISADSTSAFLPVNSSAIKSFDEKYIYLSISAKSMFQSKRASESKNPQYNETLSSFFTHRKESDNPVLIQLKPKASLAK